MLEAPALAKIKNEYREKKVQVIAVNILRSAPLDYWQKYFERWGGEGVTYAQDPTFEAVRALNIQTAGATVIIDRQGQIIFRDRSATPFELLKGWVEKAL